MNAIMPLNLQHRRKLRVEDFVLLNDAGCFADASKVELVDGDIVTVNAQYQPHAFIQAELMFRLRQAVGVGALTVLVEATVAMPPQDMPTPDIVVIRGKRGPKAVPVEQIVLIVEVADTTVREDLGRKANLYASRGVPEYWVADVTMARIVQFSAPAAGEFAQVSEIAFGIPVVSVAIPNLVIATDGLG